MTQTARTLALITGLLAASLAQAQVQIQDAWVRGTVAQQTATGAFMTLTSPSATTLVKASSKAAGVVEIHEMKKEGDVMKMRAMPQLALPKGEAVKLQPGGYHIMLMELKAPLNAGDKVDLVLEFKDAQGKTTTQALDVPIRAINTPKPAPMNDDHHHHHGMDHGKMEHGGK